MDVTRFTTLLIPIVFLLIATGCSESDELTREKAKEISLNSGIYPKERINKIYLRTYYDTKAPRGYDAEMHEKANKEFVSPALEAGLLSKTKQVATITATTDTSRVLWTLEFSEEGKAVVEKFRRGEPIKPNLGSWTVPVVTHVIQLGEVTGISYLDDARQTAMAEVTVTTEPTILANLKNKEERESNAETDTARVFFRKYDDGWRIEKPDSKTLRF